MVLEVVAYRDILMYIEKIIKKTEIMKNLAYLLLFVIFLSCESREFGINKYKIENTT